MCHNIEELYLHLYLLLAYFLLANVTVDLTNLCVCYVNKFCIDNTLFVRFLICIISLRVLPSLLAEFVCLCLLIPFPGCQVSKTLVKRACL